MIEHTSETLLTLYNESNIKAHLNLDLRERVGIKDKIGIECLEIVPVNDSGDDDDDESSVMVTINPNDDDDKDPDTRNNNSIPLYY